MITAPHTYTEQEAELIQAFSDLPTKQASYWSEPELNDLKRRAKSYYVTAQSGRCCYCQQFTPSTNLRMWDLEHMVCRDARPDFMFVPRNLAAACPDCNIAKGSSRILVGYCGRVYPTTSEAFSIVHPHLDNFDEHIYWNRQLLYLPRTEKGKRTIYMCDLLRFVQKFLELPDNPLDRRFEGTIEDLESLDVGRSRRGMQAVEHILDEANLQQSPSL